MVITHLFDESLESKKQNYTLSIVNKEYTCYSCGGKLKLETLSNVKYEYKKYICVDCGKVN